MLDMFSVAFHYLRTCKISQSDRRYHKHNRRTMKRFDLVCQRLKNVNRLKQASNPKYFRHNWPCFNLKQIGENLAEQIHEMFKRVLSLLPESPVYQSSHGIRLPYYRAWVSSWSENLKKILLKPASGKKSLWQSYISAGCMIKNTPKLFLTQWKICCEQAEACRVSPAAAELWVVSRVSWLMLPLSTSIFHSGSPCPVPCVTGWAIFAANCCEATLLTLLTSVKLLSHPSCVMVQIKHYQVKRWVSELPTKNS